MSLIVQEVTIHRNRCTFCDCSFAETHVNDIIRYLNRPIRYISFQLVLRYNSMSGIIIEICNTFRFSVTGSNSRTCLFGVRPTYVVQYASQNYMSAWFTSTVLLCKQMHDSVIKTCASLNILPTWANHKWTWWIVWKHAEDGFDIRI